MQRPCRPLAFVDSCAVGLLAPRRHRDADDMISGAFSDDRPGAGAAERCARSARSRWLA